MATAIGRDNIDRAYDRKGSGILTALHCKPLAAKGEWAGRIGAATLIALIVAAARPAMALDQDTAFMAAREAFQKGQIDRLNRLAGDLADYPLYPYVSYWQLRSHLADVPASGLPPAWGVPTWGTLAAGTCVPAPARSAGNSVIRVMKWVAPASRSRSRV